MKYLAVRPSTLSHTSLSTILIGGISKPCGELCHSYFWNCLSFVPYCSHLHCPFHVWSSPSSGFLKINWMLLFSPIILSLALMVSFMIRLGLSLSSWLTGQLLPYLLPMQIFWLPGWIFFSQSSLIGFHSFIHLFKVIALMLLGEFKTRDVFHDLPIYHLWYIINFSVRRHPLFLCYTCLSCNIIFRLISLTCPLSLTFPHRPFSPRWFWFMYCWFDQFCCLSYAPII